MSLATAGATILASTLLRPMNPTGTAVYDAGVLRSTFWWLIA
jgi:hypothetical protein